MRRRNVAFAFAVLATVLITAMVRAGGGGGHDDHGRRADRLNGFQENPDISTVARGSIEIFNIDEDAQTFDFELKYSGIETAILFAHIHFGKFGVNGGVSAFLCGGGGKPACPSDDAGEAEVTGTIAAADVIGPAGQGIEASSFDELVAAMQRGNTYANVHSTRWPGGEIRAQISPRNARH